MKSLVFGFTILTLLVLALAVPVSAADSTQQGYITVGIAPVAQFDAVYAYTTIPTVVRFTDRSLGSAPITWSWDFGDGATSTDQNPSHSYLQRGTYTVSLTVRNSYGSSTAMKKDFITVGMGPRADFVAIPTSGNAPLVVGFSDKSQGLVTSWLWDFGDGQRSTDKTPVHVYQAGGNYNVVLTVSNEFGSSDATKNQYISVAGNLVSKFSPDPATGKAPLTVKFTDLSLGSPTAWAWDFADGSTSTDQNPTHTFATTGSYDVKLTVTHGASTDVSTQTVNVGGVPNAQFDGTPLQLNVNENVQFTDRSSNSPTSWLWDFGDTATSTLQNPAHAYQLNGIYTVSLTARNANGKDSETKVGYVNVGTPPKADFRPVIVPFALGSVPMPVQFVDQTTGGPTDWQWDFGDGTTAAEQNPTHFYQKEGVYTVTLTAKNFFGSDTKVRKDLITVGGGAAVDFDADKTTVGVGQIVTFTDKSLNNPTNWVWEFGDGTVGTGSNPDHTYRAVGVYDVTLTASNAIDTESRTKNQYITVLSIPRADFVADKTRGGAPMTVTFTDKTANSPTAWKWDFGDGTTASEQNPVHTYTTLGVFTVSLTASNKDGQDTSTKTGYIVTTLAPVADFKADRQVGKAPFIVVFTDLSTNNPTSWLWEFGDGSTSSDQNPRHIYLHEGAYDVRLTVTNQYGSDSLLKTGSSVPTVGTTAVPYTVAVVPTPVVVTTSATTAPPATSAPLPVAVTVSAVVLALFAGVFRPRK